MGRTICATSFKSVGLNLNGVPTDAADRPVLSAATVKPEDVRHVEVGVKTEPFLGVTANVAVYDTSVADFQAQVVNAGVGVLRGYLANADKVRVRGLEFDGAVSVGRGLSFYAAAAYTDGKYISFPDAPPPLEETGGPPVKDISGSLLPGLSQARGVARWRIRQSREVHWANRRVLRRVRRELPLVVLVERERLAIPGGRRLLAAQRASRCSGLGGLDAFSLVPQSPEQGLLGPVVGGARQHGPLCGTARRFSKSRCDAAAVSQGEMACKEECATYRIFAPSHVADHVGGAVCELQVDDRRAMLETETVACLSRDQPHGQPSRGSGLGTRPAGTGGPLPP